MTQETSLLGSRGIGFKASESAEPSSPHKQPARMFRVKPPARNSAPARLRRKESAGAVEGASFLRPCCSKCKTPPKKPSAQAAQCFRDLVTKSAHSRNYCRN